MKENILDNEFIEKKTNLDSVTWWEEKRINFNLTLISLSLLMIFYDQYFWQPNYIKPTLLEQLRILVIWVVGANIFYSLGLGVDLSIQYYRKKSSEVIRRIFYILGLIFSILWTIANLH